MQIKALKTSLFNVNDDVFSFVTNHVKKLDENDILVVTSKIIALSCGNIISTDERTEYLKKVSTQVVKTPWALLTLTQEGWCINGAIDESNAQKGYIALPENLFEYTHTLLTKLKKKYSVKNLGLIVTDTRSVPLRVGTIGRAIGCAGFHPLKNYIGKKDLFGKKSRVTVSNVVDALAATSVLTMGEGSERTPLALISGAPVIFRKSKLSSEEKKLFLLPHEDIFTYLYKDVSKSPRKSSMK